MPKIIETKTSEDGTMLKYCESCGWLPMDQFYTKNVRRHCKKCVIERNKARFNAKKNVYYKYVRKTTKKCANVVPDEKNNVVRKRGRPKKQVPANGDDEPKNI